MLYNGRFVPPVAPQENRLIDIPTTQTTGSSDLEVLESIQKRVLWLSTQIIHYANNVRGDDGIKVGGHQASSASVVSLLTALYFRSLQSGDRVAIKPHAS